MGLRIADITAQDTGGQSFRLSRAITEYTEHTSRSFCSSSDYLAFPSDITPEKLTRQSRRDFVADYLANVDIVHVHNMYRYANRWGAINPKARWVIHQHGRIPTAQVAAFLAADEARGAVRVVSTLNLLWNVNDDQARWIPAPLRLAEYDALPRDDHATFRVAHSPTNRTYKETELFLSVVDELKTDGLDIEAVLIEQTPHDECLRIKATCDAVYDQMHLCYGNSALEGMALKIPVLVGMEPKTHRLVERVVGYRPYVTVAQNTLKKQILRLATDKTFYENAAMRGLKYVEDFHDDRVVAAKVAGIYEGIMG